ncbi:cadherin-like beta sandwich domain-containing protein [Raoultibacter timonensis]|uniref:cadherin-like beta sandwich domain-containing protein n=1 Tax=Raoultibacter timonensis TaxID=1907662 RepID=UPI000C8434E3|nr:cadherin-like beta sandwich domain-containing protein [Raoultibacter timonensis]
MSTKEASTVNSTLRQYDFGWWLRSPGDAPEFAATVIGDSGDVFQSGSRVGDARSLRPAFKLDLSSVFFTSSATVTDSKSSVGVGGGLVAAAAPTGTVKLTVEDDAQEMELQATLAQSTQSVATSESLKFSYVDATSGTNQYVSCVWTDDNDSNAPTYYGKLADSSSTASGTLSIPLGGVADGIYTVSVFSEQANGDTYTDFASTPTTMTVTVASGTATVSNFGGTILSDDATLQSLNVSAGTLDPVFSFTTTSYTVDVDNTQDSIDITGTANHASATVSGTGTKSLSVGANNFTITVTAEDGVTTKDYTITVTRAAAPTKADATKNTFSVTGGLSQTTNTDFTITAQGDLQDATGAVVGDTRYLPKQASANPTISFPASAPYTATMKITKAGSYTLSVTFEEQEWTGSAWVATGVTDTKSQPLTVADAKSNPKPLPDDGKNKLAPTGDGIPYLPIAISFVIFLGLIVIAAKRKSTNNTK